MYFNVTLVSSFYRDDKEIAVAYYRIGYVPEHYPSDKVYIRQYLMTFVLLLSMSNHIDIVEFGYVL